MKALALEPGRNCWSLGAADKAQIFIDAEEYFANLHENIQLARQSIIFLGWDFDSRLEMLRGKRATNNVPNQLGELLAHIAGLHPNIDIRILAWDFTTLYLPMREIFQKWKFHSLGRPQIRFVFDGQHPLGGSHHQKVVVIDDQIAYCGGLDLTSKRWDTSKHKARDPRRSDPSGQIYPPFHDVQIAVTGKPAQWLGELARDRWLFATGERLPAAKAKRDHHSFQLTTSLDAIPAAISRTAPAFRGRQEIREVEALFWDQIRAAQDYIYIENQYLTAPSIVDLLAETLESPTGPQILLVLPKDQSDPVSKMTMGVLTARYVKKLQAADKFGRLFVGYPDDKDLPKGQYENVHAKVLVIDDEHVRIGSSNLNNRSMGLDTECDITLLAEGDPMRRQKFRQIVLRLISNHFSCGYRTVEDVWATTPNVRGLVAKLSECGTRRLVEFDNHEVETPLPQVADLEIMDMDKPAKLEVVGDQLLSNGFQNEVGLFFRQVPVGLILTAVGCIFFSFRPGWLDAIPVGSGWLDPLFLTVVGYSLTTFLVIPFPIAVVLTIALFGYQSWPYLIVGTGLAAGAGYLMGRALGRRPARLPGRWLPQVSDKLDGAGFWSIFWSRFFPFAPFAIVSLFSGRNGVRGKDYMAGTLLGISPYLIIVYLLQNALRDWVEHSDGWSLAMVILLAIATLLGIRGVQKRFSVRHQKRRWQ